MPLFPLQRENQQGPQRGSNLLELKMPVNGARAASVLWAAGYAQFQGLYQRKEKAPVCRAERELETDPKDRALGSGKSFK